MLEELIPYFNPVKFFLDIKDYGLRFLSIPKNDSKIVIEDLKKCNLAILGVPEYRASENYCDNSAINIRNEFYKLYRFNGKENVYDLGNLKIGTTLNDTYKALSDIIYILLKNNIIPVIFGGSQDLTYSQYLAHEKVNSNINIVTIDSCLDIGNSETEFNSKSYIGKIIFNRSKSLFNFTNIGFQNYLVPKFEKELINKLHFDTVRLGSAKLDISENEPILRDADIISLDISSVKQADAPGNINSSPNGLLPEEICQLARYAGINDRISSFGIYELNTNLDINNQTSKLIAQIIWHYIEGVYDRKNEYPVENINNYKQFIVQLENSNAEFIFYKSEKTQRWWAEARNENNQKLIISCSYNDYLNSVKGDFSERILKFYQKL